MHPTTPPLLSLRIKRFIQSLGKVGVPKFLPFCFKSDDYRPRYCLSNCEADVKRNSVEMIFGWVIWESRAANFLEAEFHAVISQDGQLIDITPRVDGEPKVLFVPDLIRTATRVDNRTWDTWSNQKLHPQGFEPTRQFYLQDKESNLLV